MQASNRRSLSATFLVFFFLPSVFRLTRSRAAAPDL
jgi:hypothetical protein